VIDSLRAGDVLIVPELSRLGPSTLEILEMLKLLKERGVRVYAVKGAWKLDDTIESKILSMMFAMFAEIERDLISMRTKEALRARKAAGMKLGRPRGSLGKSKLDPHRPEIEALLKNGSTKVFVARRYGTTRVHLARYLKSRGIEARA